LSRRLLWPVWASGLVSAGLFIGLAVYLLPLQPSLVALQFAGNADAFQAIVAQWQPEGVALFRSHLPVDAVLLVAYGAFGYLLTKRTMVFARYTPVWQLRVAALMPVAALADVGENSLHWYLTSGHLEHGALLVPMATACSALKFAGIVLFGLAVLHTRFITRS
jgi:hypothetical protein